MTPEKAKQIISEYKSQILRGQLTENQHRAVFNLQDPSTGCFRFFLDPHSPQVACGGMGDDYYCCPGCDPSGASSPQSQSQAQAELKQVSSCCKADFFRDGDRVVCNACRLGTKLIHVSAA